MSLLTNNQKNICRELCPDPQHRVCDGYACDFITGAEAGINWQAKTDRLEHEAQHKADQEEFQKVKQTILDDILGLFNEQLVGTSKKALSLRLTGIETYEKIQELKNRWIE